MKKLNFKFIMTGLVCTLSLVYCSNSVFAMEIENESATSSIQEKLGTEEIGNLAQNVGNLKNTTDVVQNDSVVPENAGKLGNFTVGAGDSNERFCKNDAGLVFGDVVKKNSKPQQSVINSELAEVQKKEDGAGFTSNLLQGNFIVEKSDQSGSLSSELNEQIVEYIDKVLSTWVNRTLDGVVYIDNNSDKGVIFWGQFSKHELCEFQDNKNLYAHIYETNRKTGETHIFANNQKVSVVDWVESKLFDNTIRQCFIEFNGQNKEFFETRFKNISLEDFKKIKFEDFKKSFIENSKFLKNCPKVFKVEIEKELQLDENYSFFCYSYGKTDPFLSRSFCNSGECSENEKNLHNLNAKKLQVQSEQPIKVGFGSNINPIAEPAVKNKNLNIFDFNSRLSSLQKEVLTFQDQDFKNFKEIYLKLEALQTKVSKKKLKFNDKQVIEKQLQLLQKDFEKKLALPKREEIYKQLKELQEDSKKALDPTTFELINSEVKKLQENINYKLVLNTYLRSFSSKMDIFRRLENLRVLLEYVSFAPPMLPVGDKSSTKLDGVSDDSKTLLTDKEKIIKNCVSSMPLELQKKIKLFLGDISECEFSDVLNFFALITNGEFEYCLPIMNYFLEQVFKDIDSMQTYLSEVALKESGSDNVVRLMVKNCKTKTKNSKGNPCVRHDVVLQLRVPKLDQTFKDLNSVYVEFKRVRDGAIVFEKNEQFLDVLESELLNGIVSGLKVFGCSESMVDKVVSEFLSNRYSKVLETLIPVNRNNFYDDGSGLGQGEEYEINMYKDSSKEEKIVGGNWIFNLNNESDK